MIRKGCNDDYVIVLIIAKTVLKVCFGIYQNLGMGTWGGSEGWRKPPCMIDTNIFYNFKFFRCWNCSCLNQLWLCPIQCSFWLHSQYYKLYLLLHDWSMQHQCRTSNSVLWLIFFCFCNHCHSNCVETDDLKSNFEFNLILY